MMLDDLIPTGAQLVHMRTAPGHLENFNALHPLERAGAAHAVVQRQAEYGDARLCAHQALQRLGAPDEPILRGERGMPIWPQGFCGSLTHTNNGAEAIRAALVARTDDVHSVGIDVEVAEALPDGVLGSIARPREVTANAELRADGYWYADRLLFCAKEATYKAWYPVTHRWLGFEHADIELRRDGSFVSYLLIRPTPVPFIEGRWAIVDGYVFTTTWIPSTKL